MRYSAIVDEHVCILLSWPSPSSSPQSLHWYLSLRQTQGQIRFKNDQYINCNCIKRLPMGNIWCLCFNTNRIVMGNGNTVNWVQWMNWEQWNTVNEIPFNESLMYGYALRFGLYIICGMCPKWYMDSRKAKKSTLLYEGYRNLLCELVHYKWFVMVVKMSGMDRY